MTLDAYNTQAIDDEDISCQIPLHIPQKSSVEVQMIVHKVRFAQISSQISRRLASVKAFQQPPDELIKTVAELTKQLEQWRVEQSTTSGLGTSSNAASSASPYCGPFDKYFDYAYYGGLSAIHQTFAYPWIANLIGSEENSSFRDQVAQSTSIVADAARHMILIAKHSTIQANTPQWYVCPAFCIARPFWIMTKICLIIGWRFSVPWSEP